MYGIFTYIYHKNQPNVGKYTIHGSYGLWMTHAKKLFFVAKLQCFSLRFSGCNWGTSHCGDFIPGTLKLRPIFFQRRVYPPLYHHPHAETRPGLGDVSSPQKMGGEHGMGTLRFPWIQEISNRTHWTDSYCKPEYLIAPTTYWTGSVGIRSHSIFWWNENTSKDSKVHMVHQCSASPWEVNSPLRSRERPPLVRPLPECPNQCCRARPNDHPTNFETSLKEVTWIKCFRIDVSVEDISSLEVQDQTKNGL